MFLFIICLMCHQVTMAPNNKEKTTIVWIGTLSIQTHPVHTRHMLQWHFKDEGNKLSTYAKRFILHLPKWLHHLRQHGRPCWLTWIDVHNMLPTWCQPELQYMHVHVFWGLIMGYIVCEKNKLHNLAKSTESFTSNLLKTSFSSCSYA